MFVDYYNLFEIDELANLDTIKSAFRKQAIKWHPDRNPNIDTTKQMQLINEAYLILKDSEARSRYDKEYEQFKAFRSATETAANEEKEGSESEQQNKHDRKETKFEYEEYLTKDSILKRWMENAKMQAVELAKETVKEFAGMVSVGAKEGAKAAGQMILFQISLGVLLLIYFGLSKGCN